MEDNDVENIIIVKDDNIHFPINAADILKFYNITSFNISKVYTSHRNIITII